MPYGASTPNPTLGLIETVDVHSRVVACDGGAGPLGHPRVWLRIVGEQTFCPWCSRVFKLAGGGADDDDPGGASAEDH